MPDSPQSPLRPNALRRAVTTIRTMPYTMGAWWAAQRSNPKPVRVQAKPAHPVAQPQLKRATPAMAQNVDHGPNENVDYQDQNPDQPARTTWTKLLGHVSTAIELAPLVVPLAAAGYYQSHMAHHVFEWDYPWALAFPIGFEGGTAWAAHNYEKRLLAKNSTFLARVGLFALPAASSALLFWHALDSGVPWQAAAAIAGMTVMGLWMWLQRAGQRSQAQRQELGLVDERMVRFSLARWILCPIETARTMRFAVRYGITEPREALDRFREWRDRPKTQHQVVNVPEQPEALDQPEAPLVVPSTRTETQEPVAQPEPVAEVEGPKPEIPKSAKPKRTTPKRPKPSTDQELPKLTPAIERVLKEIDEAFPDTVPARRVAKPAIKSKSSQQIDAALKHLEYRRQAGANA